ncbi:MAG TPA: IS110 family transposase [Thermoanaerobaculia bacterium]|nr:IS110 family transposase [Thermoanaerobaculia bacterium]
MEVLVDRGAGIDVHKDSVTICVMTTEGRKVVKTLMKFTTFHDDLEAMRDWLLEMKVTHVAMESTGEYWKPVYEMLEGLFVLIVANAQHVKNVPGRKTDPQDAEWLARLLRHGLLQASFVPPAPIRDLRDLTRLRRKTIEMGARAWRTALRRCSKPRGSSSDRWSPTSSASRAGPFSGSWPTTKRIRRFWPSSREAASRAKSRRSSVRCRDRSPGMMRRCSSTN